MVFLQTCALHQFFFAALFASSIVTEVTAKSVHNKVKQQMNALLPITQAIEYMCGIDGSIRPKLVDRNTNDISTAVGWLLGLPSHDYHDSDKSAALGLPREPTRGRLQPKPRRRQLLHSKDYQDRLI